MRGIARGVSSGYCFRSSLQGWAAPRAFEVIVKRAERDPTISPVDDTLFVRRTKRTVSPTLMIPRGYLQFPRVYLHITPSHVHAPASASGFSHWTSIRPLSSVPSPPPLFCLRFLVSLFLLCRFFFIFLSYLRQGLDLREVRKLANKAFEVCACDIESIFFSNKSREIYFSLCRINRRLLQN